MIKNGNGRIWYRGLGRDRERTDDSASAKKREIGKQRAQEGEDQDHDDGDAEGEDNGRFRRLGHLAPPYITSLPLMDAVAPSGTSISTSHDARDDENSTAAAAAHMSTSPSQGPMLTNRDEVDERLKMMNENFLKSLEGVGSRSRRSKRKVLTTMRSGKDDASTGASTSTSHSDSNSKERSRSESVTSSSSAASNTTNTNDVPTSRFSPLGFPSTSSSRGGGGAAPQETRPLPTHTIPPVWDWV